MAKQFQTGAEHYLYLGYTTSAGALTGLLTFDDTINTSGTAVDGGTSTINDITANLQLLDNIRDVEVGGDNQSIDTTVREDARQGFSTEIIATSSANMTFEHRYKPRDSADGSIQDLGFEALMRAFLTKAEIAAIDCDFSKATDGAQGLAANFTVGYSQSKPVAGLVVVNWTLTASSKTHYVWNDNGTWKNVKPD